MKEYIEALGAAVILSALIDMLVPEGGFKKYCRLVCGFMVIAVMLSPITGQMTDIYFDGQTIDAEAAELEARARVLMEHRSNLEKIIESEIPGSEAHVEVDGEGNVTRVTIEGAEDEAAAREYIREAMGVEGSSVRINENKGTDEG